MTSKYKIKGLTKEQVEKSKADHGANELPPPEIATFWDSLLENFEDPLIRILMVALVITCARLLPVSSSSSRFF